ncbi:hypothetical protein HYX11_04165 [Candidatus Woesearchaeota archaeon]|nr:hypothetical protein [Candidatus Woesearchaeota archaeon]
MKKQQLSQKQTASKTDKIDLEIFAKNNSYIQYLLKNQKNILLALLFILILIPIVISNSSGNPFLIKSESYYHLTNSQELNFFNPNYLLLNLIQKIIPYKTMIILPLFLGLACFLLLQHLLKKFNFSEQFSFFFTLFLIISPIIILEFSNITFNLFFLFFSLLTFYLLSSEKKYRQYLAIIPLIFIPFLNTYLSLTFLTIILIYTISEHQKSTKLTSKTIINIFFILFAILLILINSSLLRQPFFSGPFYSHAASNLISDLGGYYGISIFLFLLAIFGITISWKKSNYYLAYFTLPLLIGLYFGNEAVFIVSLILTFFATVGFLNIFEAKWENSTLKQFTLLIIILGLSFSTLSYLNRINDFGPTNNDYNTLVWIKENILSDTIILSAPENYDSLAYFSQHHGYISLRDTNSYKNEQFAKILEAKYTHELFPLLEKNNIDFIYINKKVSLDQKYQYLLFLLKNERFKMVHSSQDTEIWVFK